MTEQAGEIRPVSIRRFLSETAIYGLLDIADKAIGLLLLPLTTYILVPADYGILSLFGTSLQFLSLIIGLGMQSTFIRFYAEKHEKSHQLAVLNTVFAIAACSAFLWLAILFSLSKVLSQALFDQDSISLVILLGVNATLDVHNTLGMCRLRMDGQLVPFFWISIASTLCKRGIGVLLMLLGYGAFGWIIGELIGLTLTAVLIWLNALTGLSFRVDRTLVVTLLLFGVNFVPISASHWLMLSSDKYMIKELMDDGSGEVGATYVGYYGVGERISSILSLVVMAFTMGWQRFAYHNIHLPDGPRLIAKSGTLYVSMIGYVAMALALLGDDLIK